MSDASNRFQIVCRLPFDADKTTPSDDCVDRLDWIKCGEEMANMRSTSMNCIACLFSSACFRSISQSRAGNLCTNHLTWVSVSLSRDGGKTRLRMFSECEYAAKLHSASKWGESNGGRAYLPRIVCCMHECDAVQFFSSFVIRRFFFRRSCHACCCCRTAVSISKASKVESSSRENVSRAEEKCVLWHFYDEESGICMEINIRITGQWEYMWARNQIAEKIRSLYVCTKNSVHEEDYERWSEIIVLCVVCVCARARLFDFWWHVVHWNCWNALVMATLWSSTNRRCIKYFLSYWKHLPVRHCHRVSVSVINWRLFTFESGYRNMANDICHCTATRSDTALPFPSRSFIVGSLLCAMWGTSSQHRTAHERHRMHTPSHCWKMACSKSHLFFTLDRKVLVVFLVLCRWLRQTNFLLIPTTLDVCCDVSDGRRWR